MDNCFLVSFAGSSFLLAHSVAVTLGSVHGSLLSFTYIISLEISSSTVILSIDYVITPKHVCPARLFPCSRLLDSKASSTTNTNT